MVPAQSLYSDPQILVAIVFTWFITLVLIGGGFWILWIWFGWPAIQRWRNRRRFNRMVRMPAVRISRIWTD